MKNIETHLDSFRPVMAYEQNLGRNTLTILRISFFVLFICCVVTLLTVQQLQGNYSPALLGSTLVFFALWLEQVLLYLYHNSFYFRGFDSVIGSGTKDSSGISYEVARILLKNEDDITGAFMSSRLGLEVLIRSGVSTASIENFCTSNRTFLSAQTVPLKNSQVTDVTDLGSYIYMYDLSFKLWLEQNAITQETFLGALQFVVKNYHRVKSKKRWWSRDRLSLHAGLGRGLSSSVPYELEKYSYQLRTQDIIIEQNSNATSYLKTIQQIEQVLAKNRSANIVLVAEAENVALDVLAQVQSRITTGNGLNALAGLDFSVLDYINLFSATTEKYQLEDELITLFNQAVQSGTQVIIIPHMSHFISEAAIADVDIPNLLGAYLTSSTLHIIGIDTPQNFQQSLGTLRSFYNRFEEIVLEAGSINDTIAILEPIALRQEKRRGVFFTYDAIIKTAEHALRHLVSGTMPERAIDLIHEIAQQSAKQGTVLITPDFVDAIVSKKVGIQIGAIDTQEKDTLLHLEEILHKRIVGQERAVHAIASTMRRARVAIERADKPRGSFLFLGGTGVGKTETAKALAYTFFGDETHMVRFDMTEYSADHTLAYLIGDENGVGTLTHKLQEHPYCVLLLDEFEKAAPSVQDLFLQILDEGHFTSTHGTVVNACNTIIIATSNAGSELIWKTTSVRQQLPNMDTHIIDHIIETGVFKAELINRFDNTIIYEPLEKQDLHHVGKLMINELTVRTRKEGYHVVVSPELMNALVEIGYDPKSGGRRLTRVLQNTLEEKIATKIIAGDIKKGGNLHLDLDDFTPEELAV